MRGHTIISRERGPHLLPQCFLDLISRPDKEFSFFPFAIGILSGIKTPFRSRHLPDDILENLLPHLTKSLFSSRLISFKIGTGEKGIVIEHLLKMGDEPSFIHGIAVESPTQMVNHPPMGHFLQAQFHHSQGFLRPCSFPLTEKKGETHAARKLRGSSEPPIGGIELALHRLERLIQDPCLHGLLGRSQPDNLLKSLLHLGNHLIHFPPVGTIVVREDHEDLWKSWHPTPVFRRKVSARMEGNEIRGQKDVQGPAPAAGHYLSRIHINFIKVRPFFPIDLDANKFLVHDLRNCFVFEAFLLHHMAPVAGGVTNTEEDGLILLPGPAQRFLAPRVPIDRVVSMLQKIGTGLMDQPIRISRLFFHSLGFSCIPGILYNSIMIDSPCKFNIKMWV